MAKVEFKKDVKEVKKVTKDKHVLYPPLKGKNPVKW